jgi:hypothetical protein
VSLDPKGTKNRDYLIKSKIRRQWLEHQQRTLDIPGTKFHNFINMSLGRNPDEVFRVREISYFERMSKSPRVGKGNTKPIC